jgi:hypothetical protein
LITGCVVAVVKGDIDMKVEEDMYVKEEKEGKHIKEAEKVEVS